MVDSMKNSKSKSRRILNVVGIVLATPAILLFAAMILLYVPAIQNHATRKCSELVAQNSDFGLDLGSFRLHFPLNLTITDYTLYRESDTIVSGERLKVNIEVLPLFRGEVEVNYVSLSNTTIDSHDLIDGMQIEGTIGHFRTAIRNLKIAERIVNINQLYINDSHVALTTLQRTEPQDTTAASPTEWKIAIKKGKLENSGFEMREPKQPFGMAIHTGSTELRNAVVDLGKGRYSLDELEIAESIFRYDRGSEPDSIAPTDHLCFGNISARLEGVHYSPDKIAAKLHSLGLAQQPQGLTIENARMTLHGDSNSIVVDDLSLSSHNGSLLNATATIPGEALSGHAFEKNIDAAVALHIDKRDLVGFLTAATYNSLAALPDSMLNMEASLRGNSKKIALDTLYATIPAIATVTAKGEAADIASKNRSFDVDIYGETKSLARLMSLTKKSDTIQSRPIRLKGNASLYRGEYRANATLATGKGKADIVASYMTDDNSYEATANFHKFALSEILPQVALHEITMIATADGKGFDLFDEGTEYRCSVVLDALAYDTLSINNITLNAQQKKHVSDIHIMSAYSGLKGSLFANTLLKDSTVTNSTKVKIEEADVRLLGLAQSPTRASMAMSIEAFTDFDNRYTLKGTGEDILLVNNRKKYTPENISIYAATDNDSTLLELQNGDLSINGYLSAGYKAIMKSVADVTSLVEKNLEARDTIIDIRRYERLLPEAKIAVSAMKNNIAAEYLSAEGIGFDAIDVRCNLDSTKGLNAFGKIFHFTREQQHFDTLRFALSQDSTRLRYFAGMRSRATENSEEKATFGAALHGALERNKLTANYIFRDRKDDIGMKLGLTARMTGGGFRFNFTPDAILFRHPFRFNDENEITLDKAMNIRGNIELRDSANSGMNLYAYSDSINKRDIYLELFNIDLKSITRTLPFAPDIAGMVNADLHYRENSDGMMIGSDIRSEQLEYEGTLIGDEILEFSYIPRSSTEHYTYLTLMHYGDEVAHMEGIYSSDSLQPEDMGKLQLSRFPVTIANAFIKDSGIAASGYINGDMSIRNEDGGARADGYVQFDSVYTDIPQFGTALRMVDDKIDIKENILHFNEFDIYAKGNTPFKINGTIDMNRLLDPKFNLRMTAKEYEIVNAKQTKGSMLYGRMFINVNSRISGMLSALNVNGAATILGKSDFTYVIQDTPLETENSLDGLVTFTNFNDTTEVVQETAEYDLGNINMNITLNIEEGARINADFDEARSSYIKLQGEGNLNLTYSSEAGMNLTGRYLLSDGELKYTLPIIPLKTFTISQGSYINWNGEIMNPTLNITATERVISPVTIDNSNQAVAFDVGVKLTNSLEQMGLSFTLSAPENAAVQNQLNSVDAETLNKYALTMLVTGVYTGGENSLNASNALSSFLDNQINNFVGNVMDKSVDINVGITDLEDKSTGDNYKNYSFSFTKRFWNDRLKVVIGGEVNNNEHATNNESFINNVSLEWKISNSGNRYLRIFYDKNYESILEGEIIETGVGYIYKRKLNNLNELLIFKRKENEKAIPARDGAEQPRQEKK